MGPDLIIAGMMKSGTTSLYRWLERHPAVAFSSLKEPHFFCDQWHRGTDWYESLFPPADPGVLRVEASQSYTNPDDAEVVVARLLDLVPRVRLVFVLRHPVERARSEYRHQVIMGRERRPFSSAITDEATPYLRRSLYYTCLSPFLRSFPSEQMYFLRFEDLVAPDPTAWRRLLEWAGLEYIERIDVDRGTTQRSSSRMPRKLTAALRATRGWSIAARVLPKTVRRAARPILFRSREATNELIASACAALPASLEARVWEDAARMEDWLGWTLEWDARVCA